MIIRTLRSTIFLFSSHFFYDYCRLFNYVLTTSSCRQRPRRRDHSIWSSLSCSILHWPPHCRTIGDRISTKHAHCAPVLTSVALAMARLISHSSCVITIVMCKSSDLLCVVVVHIITKLSLTSSSQFQWPLLEPWLLPSRSDQLVIAASLRDMKCIMLSSYLNQRTLVQLLSCPHPFDAFPSQHEESRSTSQKSTEKLTYVQTPETKWDTIRPC